MSGYLILKNRKALHDYQEIDRYSAGLVLRGYEVKAIKEKKVSFDGSFVQILKGEPYVVNLYIGRYSKQSSGFNELDARRTRKLLLNRKEIADIQREVPEKGKTAVPLALVVSHKMIKLEFAVVRGKKEYDKKQVAKERQMEKDLERDSKEARQFLGV